MQQFDTISRIVFYALRHDLSYRDYGDLSSAVKAQPYLIIQETTGFWFNYDYTNSLAQLNLFNPSGQEIFELHEMGWRLDSPEIRDIPDWPPYRTTEFFARILDPLGIVYPRKNYGNSFNGLIKSIKFLREMAQFECIEHFELSKKNKTLKAEVDQLESSLQQLKELINKP
jgi:hypothetical protein